MAKSPVTEEAIREAAYHLWKNEGEPHGQDQDYWYRAEAELTPAKPARKPAAKKAAAPKAEGEVKAAAAKPAAAKKPAAKKPAVRKAPAKKAAE